MALQVNIHEAKTNLSRLLARVREGEEIIIAPDFDAPLSESVLAEFER